MSDQVSLYTHHHIISICIICAYKFILSNHPRNFVQ
jgi:hypothetical protein